MAAHLMQSIQRNLETLLSTYAANTDATGILQSIKRSLDEYLAALPESLLHEIHAVLRLLVGVKSDNAQLWGQVVLLKERLAAVEKELKGTGEQLAIRQVYHALNEKLLRLVAAKTGLPEEVFWDKFKVQNLGALTRHEKLRDIWKQLQQELALPDSPEHLWEDMNAGKEQFDVFVHVGIYPKLTYEEMKEVAAKYFVGNNRKFRPVFMDVLELNHRISQKQNKSLYDY